MPATDQELRGNLQEHQFAVSASVVTSAVPATVQPVDGVITTDILDTTEAVVPVMGGNVGSTTLEQV